ncbi:MULTISPECIES: CoA ester lyase [unclassified Nitratiruptor]|uniref:HpcH/HpaI aldolase/citrate lyase family protein n=1 Tax=unclassified Nitratiruptor TaxID=2624044 RepID=UPI00191651AF|nr:MULTISPECIES: aldolase/citrate lyase family protein [unclassified Nitratiruptor]BCD60016.1 citrate lyase subunit beta / citryl-CoA lyase [Nitratiruptor sp. YY08-10]BCD63939.1 citrate lyase subunit beta / citryl-CoA lyase [Nitratiruptor sp. YY08-14]
MIFDAATIERIQAAIDAKDIDFFRSMLQPGKRPKRAKLIHTALMVSAHRAKHLNKLDEIKADAVILNLEDGVAPEYKEIARYALAYFLQHVPENVPLLVVRTNPLQEGGEEEIEFLNPFFPDAFRIPKVRQLSDVKNALWLADDAIDIHLSIETKEAFSLLTQLRVEERVQAYYLGILDLLADLNIEQSVLKLSNPTIDYILARFLVESKTAGVLPVSFVYQEYQNLEEFEAWCKYEKTMGFSAKACISPKQVEIANRIFASFDIERAKYIKKRFEEMAKQGITGFRDEKYGFIDEPIYRDALNILKRL